MCPACRLMATTITPNALPQVASRDGLSGERGPGPTLTCSVASSRCSELVARCMKSTTAGRSAVCAIWMPPS